MRNRTFSLKDIYVQSAAVTIRDLCESRDSCDLIFDRHELHIFIETSCTI